MILTKMGDNSEAHLSKQQFGVGENRGTVDDIFIERQIMEKANKHQVPLHFNFVDFKAAFDTIWRGALWRC